MQRFKILILIFLIPVLASCQPIDEVKKQIGLFKIQVMELIGLESKSTTKKKKKTRKVKEVEPEPDTQAIEVDLSNQGGTQSPQQVGAPPEPTNQAPSEPQNPAQPTDTQVPPTQPEATVTTETTPTQPGVDSPSFQPPLLPPTDTVPTIPDVGAPPIVPEPPKKVSPDDNLPIKRVRQIGGGADWVESDQRFVYVAFGRYLSVWDAQFNPRGMIPLEAKPIHVVSIMKSQETYLYIKEEGNILEIFKLPALGAAQFVKGFQVDGPFDGAYTRLGGASPSQDHLFVFLPDRIQVLDVSQPEKIQVIAEPVLAGVKQVLMAGAYAYALKDGSLVVLDAANYTIIGTVPLEGEYEILGVRKGLDKNKIVLGKKEAAGFTAYRFVATQAQGGAIADMGQDVSFEKTFDQVKFDDATGYLVALQSGVPTIFDTASNQVIPLKSSSLQGVLSASLQNASFLSLWPDKIKRFDWKINTALASQAAEPKPSTSEMLLTGEKKVVWPVNVGKFIIPNQYQLMLFSPEVEGANFFETVNFKTNLLKPYSLANLNDVRRIRMGILGVYFLDQKSSRVFLRKWDGSFSELPQLSALKFKDFDIVVGGTGDTIMGLGESKTKPTLESIVYSYALTGSSAPIKKGLFTVPLATSLRLFSQGSKAALACGVDGLCIVELKEMPPTEKGLARGGMVPVLKVKTQVEAPEATVLSVNLSLDEKVAFAYTNSSNGSFFSVIDLATQIEASVVPLVGVTLSQFEGMSYALGGKRLLMPADEGLLVFDLKDIRNPSLLFKWPIGRVDQVDVTNRGQTFCVSQGEKGIECADFQSDAPAAVAAPAAEEQTPPNN